MQLSNDIRGDPDVIRVADVSFSIRESDFSIRCAKTTTREPFESGASCVASV